MGNLSYPKISFQAKASPQAIKKINNLIRRLNYIKAKDEEFFELNGGSLDILMLLQFLQQAKNEAKAQNNTHFSPSPSKMNQVLMKYCPICKRYIPMRKFCRHMAKHKEINHEERAEN